MEESFVGMEWFPYKNTAMIYCNIIVYLFKSRSVLGDFTNMFMKKHNKLPHKLRRAADIIITFSLLFW